MMSPRDRGRAVGVLRTAAPTLDALVRALSSPNVAVVSRNLGALALSLRRIFDDLGPAEWAAFKTTLRAHPIHALLQEDPLTRRRCPGDADTLDAIFGLGCVGADLSTTTPRGRRLHLATRMLPACQAIRSRHSTTRRLISRTLQTCSSPRVLALSAGYLREAEAIPWVAMEHLDLFLATDPDAASTAAIQARDHHPRLEARPLSVGALLEGRLPERDFDLIYAAGLLDILDERRAAMLAASVVGRLRPGGSAVLTGFVPEAHDRGYLDAIMDWQLAYRSEAQLRALAPRDAAARTWREETGQIAFMEIRRPR